jgi:cytochrome c-type biogenesis protein CcmH
MRRAIFLALALSCASPVLAVQPDEMLADPGLEARARNLSQGLRCLVCRNENIDDSDAQLARDLRILLRERLTAGDTDAQAVQFLVDRYGEYVLLAPTTNGWNLLLWGAGPLMLLAGIGIAVTTLRRKTTAPDDLSEEERARLAALLEK